MTTVWIDGLECYSFHGVPDAEQTIGHRYRCDLGIELSDCPARQTDDIADTVSYAEAARLAIEILQGPSRRTIEFLAHAIASAVLELSPRVSSVTVRLGKPLPPAPLIVQAMGVTTTVQRATESD